jgi:hypothetical protein
VIHIVEMVNINVLYTGRDMDVLSICAQTFIQVSLFFEEVSAVL